MGLRRVSNDRYANCTTNASATTDADELQASDQSGNVNNVLVVAEQESKPLVDLPAEKTPAPIEHALNTKDAYIMEDEPSVVADSDKSAHMYPPPEEIVHKLGAPQPIEQQSVDGKVTLVNEKQQVQVDDQPGKIVASDVHTRKDSIPDIAPPPYSVAADGPDEVKPEKKHKVAQYDEDHDTSVTKASSGKKHQSLLAQFCSQRYVFPWSLTFISGH